MGQTPEVLRVDVAGGTLGVHDLTVGPADDGAPVVQPLRELAEPLIDLSGPWPWLDLQSGFDALFPKGQLYYWKSRALDDSARRIVRLAATNCSATGTQARRTKNTCNQVRQSGRTYPRLRKRCRSNSARAGG